VYLSRVPHSEANLLAICIVDQLVDYWEVIRIGSLQGEFHSILGLNTLKRLKSTMITKAIPFADKHAINLMVFRLDTNPDAPRLRGAVGSINIGWGRETFTTPEVAAVFTGLQLGNDNGVFYAYVGHYRPQRADPLEPEQWHRLSALVSSFIKRGTDIEVRFRCNNTTLPLPPRKIRNTSFPTVNCAPSPHLVHEKISIPVFLGFIASRWT
jgi:hypothetical protein